MHVRTYAFTLLAALAVASLPASAQPHRVQLICHRTANRDAPENTMESLALAARMGCDEVEIDIRRTLDGVLVLNHDGFLERFTDSIGEIETITSEELDLLDFGAYYGPRYRGIRLARFDEALRFARDHNILLHLDLKTDDLAEQAFAAAEHEHATQNVLFSGHWQHLNQIPPRPPAAWLQPGFTVQQVTELHAQGKTVIANFSANPQEGDLSAMRAAVAMGVDGLNVDYPRLGAEAAGRPVEATIAKLIANANSGTIAARRAAIAELALFYGFPLQPHFFRWMADGDETISHAAAVTLVTSRPSATVQQIAPLLQSPQPNARRAAAWALGRLSQSTADASCATHLLPLLDDRDAGVAQQALLSLSWCPPSPSVTAARLLPLLRADLPITRGLAAMALARHVPDFAAKAVPSQLAQEEALAARDYAAHTQRANPKLTQAEIDRTVELYRAQMKFMEALAMLPRDAARFALSAQAFRSVEDYSRVTGLYAGYQLWDRLSADPLPAIRALGSPDAIVADRAEWALVEAGAPVLPAVRTALPAATPGVRSRLLHVLAWQADADALPMLRHLLAGTPGNFELQWTITKIEALHPELRQ